MEKSIKNVICGLLTLYLIVFIVFINTQVQASMVLVYDGQSHTYDALPITINIDGKTLTNLVVPPVIIDGSTLVPASEVFTALGAVVNWNKDSQEVYIGLNGNLMILKIDSKEANLNGSVYTMNYPAKTINDKAMIPLRFPLEAFGYIVNWNPAVRVISVGSPPDIEIDPMPAPTPVPTQAAQPTPTPTTPAWVIPAPTTAPTAMPVSNQEPGTSEESFENKLNFSSQGSDASNKIRDMSPAEIPVMKYPETVATKINVDQLDGFSIEARSEINRVEKLILPDNRLVIDIYDAECWLDPLYDLPSNPIVARIRTAQNQVTPVKITRIVFDLNVAASFSLTISQDRKTLYLSFERNNVLGVTFSQAGNVDRVTVICERPPGYEDFPLTSPDRIVIDVQLATLKQPVNQVVSGKFISSVRAEQFDTSITRVVLDLNQIAKYEIEISGNTIVIELSEMTVKNMIYFADQSAVKIKKNSSFPVDINTITHIDDYNELTYTLNLNGNFKDHLGFGEYVIKNAYMYSFEVENNAANQTEIRFNENQIFAFDVTEDAEYITIKFMNPKKKYPRVVVLDAGHGGNDLGTNDKLLKEKDIVLDVLLRTMKLFEVNKDIKVYATRQTDVYVERSDRAAMANQIADAFISIHVNSASRETDTGPNGTEVHYLPHSNDDTIGITTKQFAQLCQDNMLAALGSNDRKIKNSNFQVLRETVVPSVLIELGFRTNPAESSKLRTPEYRQKAAVGIYNSVVELFAKYTPKR